MLGSLPTAAAVGALTIFTSLVQARVRPDGVGRLPALAWNTWNMYACDITEEKIVSAAKMMIELGLQDVGYEYVNIDDCWSIKDYRDNDTHQIVPDPIKFPRGIKVLVDEIHDLGFKVGIYSSAGAETCAFYPASLEYEEIDAATWAAWGIDYVKYDNCGVPDDWKDDYTFCVPDSTNPGPFVNGTCPELAPVPAGYDWSKSLTAIRFRTMRDAIERQNRTMLYSLCQWGQADVTSWGNDTASSWRMSGDIVANWKSIMEILNQNSFLLNAVDFWGHNDPDMLEVGNGDLTYEEQRSHFALWAAMKSPLIIGTDLSTLSAELVDILKNPYLLAFNQDGVFGKPAKPYRWGINPDWSFNATHPAEYWSGASQQGTLVLLLNTLEETVKKQAIWAEIPELEEGQKYSVSDIWTGKDLGCYENGFEVEVTAHDTAALLIKPCAPEAITEQLPLNQHEEL